MGEDMIRKLIESDNEQTMIFLKQEPEYNIFIIGDIEQFGYVSDFQTLWGEFINKELKAVLLKYRNNCVYYSPIKRSIEPFKEILDVIEFHIMNGKKEVVDVFEEYLKGWEVSDMYFAALNSFTMEDIDVSEVKLMETYEDFCDEFKMLENVDEFGVGDRETMEEYSRHQHKITEQGARTSYYYKKDNQMVSVASVVAENSVNGMVIAVATDKNYRKQGLASLVMNKLCNEYLNVKGKSICLFFDNPKAGKIYHRLGFVDVGYYRMYERPKKQF